MLNKMLKLALATVLAFTSVFTTSIVNHTAVVEAASEAVFKSTTIATINNGSGVIVADADAINAVKNLNDFTMNAKIKLTGTSTVQSVFFLGDSSNSSNNYVSIWMNKSNTVGIESFNASGAKQIGVSATSSVAFNDDQEHYFTFRYTKGGKFQVFIDGQKAAEMNTNVAFSNGFFSDGATMYLGFGMGARKSGNNYPFTGTIGAVECYDYAISDADVSNYITRNAELSSLVWKVENVAEATSTTEFAGINTLTKGAVTVRYRAKEANTGMISLFKLSNGSQYAEVYVNPSQNKVGYKTADKDMNMTKVGTGASDASLSINDTEWHTFCVRYDGTKVYFYLDDVQFASNIFWTYGKWLASVTNATELSYGASNAYVESIRVHNEMLSADDFQKIQNQYAFESKLVDGMEGAYVTEPIDLFYPGLDGSSAYRIPSLLTTDKGTVIAAIDQRYTGTGDAGNIDTVVRRREKGSDTWGECIDVVDLVDNNNSTPSAFMIDPSMLQDRETGRIFMLVDMYPHSSGLMNTGILVSGDGYEEINGVEYQEVFQDTVKFGTIREDGIVYDKDGNKTDYVVVRECEAPYKELGNVYYKGEYAGNAFIYDGANKGAIQIARTSYLWLSYSDDDGKTWSCPKDITPMVKFDFQGFLGTGPGVGLQLQDGTLCFPVYGARNENLGGSQASAIIYSTDGGETWAQGKSPVTAYDTPLDPATMADGGKIVTESQMVQLNNGTVLLFMRNYSGTVRVATSTDGGKTWDKIENTPIFDCYCQLSVLHYNNNGKEYVIMSNPGASGRNVGAINLAEVNADGTLTWKYKNIIEPGRYLYSCLTLLDKDAEGDQVFGLIYEYEPNSMYLKYVEFDEKWITNEEVWSTRPAMEVEDYLVEQNGTTYDVTVTFNQPVIVFPNAKLTTTNGEFTLSRRLANNAVVFTGTIEQLDDVVTATGFEGIIENEVAEQAEVSFVIAKPEADKVTMSGAVVSTQASSSTAEAQDGAGVNAIDGNPLTYWHSRYTSADSLPQDIVITLAQETSIYKMEYLPRQNSQSGRVKDYEVYVSTNGTDYTKVTSGTFTTGTDLQSVEFAPATAKYVKFVALTSTAKESCAIAELAFYAYEDGIYEAASAETVASVEAKLAEVVALSSETKYSSASKEGLAVAKEALELLLNAEQPYSEAMAANAIANADKAIAKLVDITPAKAAYEAAIAKTNNNKYTEESWTAYQTALAGLEDIIATATTTRAVTDVTMKIAYAESLLEELPVVIVDKIALETLVNKANELDPYAYKDFKPVMDALFDANGVLANEKATQAEVDAVLKVLQDAIDSLEVSDTTAPIDPETFNVIPGKNSVTFEWSASTSDDVAYYELVSLPSHEVIKRVTTTSFVWESLEAGISGEVMLYTYDEAGNRSSGIQSGYITLPELTAPTKVENVKAKDTNYKTITLTWNASETATAYDVYRKAYDSEEFKLYKTVEDTTLAVSGVMTGKEYAFYVVAKNEVGAAQASETVAQATTLHGKVKLTIEKVSTATFKLSWNKIDGATRYIVYRKRNDDKMKKVLTLGSKELEYTTAELPHGDYQFILKAGRYDSKDRVMTGSSNTVKGSVEELAPTVTLKAGTKSVKVSWKKVEGVTHYQVYRATSSTGKYTKLITTKELSYTAKSLSSGKKYFFKVRGYKQYKSGDDVKYTVYTPYSSAKSATAK